MKMQRAGVKDAEEAELRGAAQPSDPLNDATRTPYDSKMSARKTSQEIDTHTLTQTASRIMMSLPAREDQLSPRAAPLLAPP